MQKIIFKCQLILKNIFENSNEIAGGISYRYFHGLRTMEACKKILTTPELKNKKVHKLELFIAALFHDVGKAIYIEKDGTLQGNRSMDKESHEEIGGNMIINYLKNIMPEKNLQFIAKIIKEQHNTKSLIIETKILNDADVLDSIGLINTWRMFTYSGKKGRSLEETLEYYKKISKDLTRKEIIYFSITKKTAKKRQQILKKFIEDFQKEYSYKD